MKKKDVLKWAVMGLAIGSAMTSCTSSSPKQDDQQGGSSCSGKRSPDKTDKSSCNGKSSCGSEASVNEEKTENKLGALKQKREDAAKKMC